MERFYSENNSRLHRLMAWTGVISPINEQSGRYYPHPFKSPSFGPRANSDILNSNFENLESPLIRYLRSGSPLSSIENFEISPQLRSPTVFKTPVKVEEDVLVMDGILVGPVTSGRTKSSSSASDSGGSSSGGKNVYKTEICRAWEDTGSCRYGIKCQFAHGKEELRPVRFPNKNRSETCKSYSSGSCSYGSKCRFARRHTNSPASATDSVASSTTRTISPFKLEPALSSVDSITITTSASSDWSPLDDGIEMVLPFSTSDDEAPSWEEVDAYIDAVLYGPKQKKTLPVFAEICPR